MEYVIQGIGILGAIFAFIAFQCRRHFMIMSIKTCSALCFVVQFALMKAYTGFAMNVFGVVILITNAVLVAKKIRTLPFVIVFSAICVGLGAISWVGPVSLLAIVGELIVTIACGIKNPEYLRYVYISGSVCWLIYDCIYFSLGGVITEAFTLISIIIAIFRTVGNGKMKKG